MKLVTQTDILAKSFGGQECVRILAKAGFDAADWSFFDMERGEGIWCGEGWREYALSLKQTGMECGLDFSWIVCRKENIKIRSGIFGRDMI